MTLELAARGMSRSFYVLVYAATIAYHDAVDPVSTVGLGPVDMIMTSDTTFTPFYKSF